jgi:drug/metabolite transporter (DMT)-like permease
MTSATTRNNLPLGIAFIVAAFFCVAVMSTFGKAASGVPVAMISFFQSFISLVLFLPWVLRHGRRDLKTGQVKLNIFRALSGLLSQVLYFQAVREMPLVDAVLLVNAAPLFIPLVALVWSRTPISAAVGISLAVGFIGVAMIIHPSKYLLVNPSALIALSAAVFSAIALVTVNKLSATDPADTILFYYFLIASLATAPFAVASWANPTPVEWGYLLGIGVFMALAQLLIILAYRHAAAGQIAPFNFSVVVFSGLIGWAVWHEPLSLGALFGILLVCVGGILSLMLGASSHRPHCTFLHHGHGLRIGTTEAQRHEG